LFHRDVLSALGETINLMTLGGLALAVGILVDDATVAIENIHHHMASGQAAGGSHHSRLAGNRRCPAFVSTLCICIVFVPMFFLTGRGALSVRAAGGGRGVRDARQLRDLADARADAGDVVLPQRPLHGEATGTNAKGSRSGSCRSSISSAVLKTASTVSATAIAPAGQLF
jgi:hypothetical protein